MAVTLVVEDGTGLSTANSYLTVLEAEDILCVNPTAYATWTALTPTEKDTYLVWASGYIDDYVDWNGYKTVEDSGLRWPRCGVYNRDGILIGENDIPPQLKQAVAEIAVFLVNSSAAASGGQSSNLPEGIKRVKADVVEIEFFEDGSSDSQTGSDLLPVNISFLIIGLGTVITGRIRVGKVIR
jgi:hypothetical protein